MIKETLRLRPVLAVVVAGAAASRWRSAAACCRRGERGAVHLPDPPASGRLPGPACIPARALPRPAAGTYTWIPFGGGVRRCLGASFAQFEIKVVLRELVARLDIRAARPAPERRVRRAIVFAPERGGEVVVERRVRKRESPGAVAA